MAKLPTCAELRHRITLCSARDVIISGSEIVLDRHEVTRVWAAIAESKGSLFANGFPVDGAREQPTHRITIRYRSDLDLTATAWVYEERGTSQPRWFKVLDVVDVEERGRWWRLGVRLTNRADFVTPPAPSASFSPVVALPPGVRL